jgi:anti-sigma regulatory factor (Ser/Thr protein kinase)/serine/threonine protein phosphatase PrpC
MEKKVIHISHALDAAAAHHAAREMAARIGFGEKASEEIAIAVSELASNQLKHAQGGTILIEPLGGERPGIQVEAMDAGPGIPNIDEALADGFSTAGGLGLGLGTVNRLMEVFDIVSQPGQGTQILCQRWLKPAATRVSPSPLDIGVATRPYMGMGVNGDAFVVRHWGDQALAGVIDGLGHGQLAYQAAEAARQYVETHANQPLRALFTGTARACLSTRGVVMALARFDFSQFPAEWNRREDALPSPKDPFASIRFSFASLGNIEVRFLSSPEPVYFNLRRGVVGVNAPNVIVTEHAWNKDCILIIHSDGLTTHWQPGDFPEIRSAPASEAAQKLLVSLAKEDDDATIVVVKAGRKDAVS